MRASGLRLTAALVMAGFCSATAASAEGTKSATHDGEPAWTESGEASWYGPRHEGLRTTSGERFDSRKLTAAHPSLPMGAYVRVTVEETGRSIVVRVNDREPPHGVRCIDLSREAAARLGIVNRGVADVTLARVAADEAVELAEAPPDGVPAEHRKRRHHRR